MARLLAYINESRQSLRQSEINARDWAQLTREAQIEMVYSSAPKARSVADVVVILKSVSVACVQLATKDKNENCSKQIHPNLQSRGIKSQLLSFLQILSFSSQHSKGKQWPRRCRDGRSFLESQLTATLSRNGSL